MAVVVVHVILQFFQRTAHQHRPPGIGQGLHRRAAKSRKDMLGQTGEGIAFHHTGKGIAQLPVDARLGAGGKLLRHQQDTASARARMRAYSRVVLPLPEAPRTSFSISVSSRSLIFVFIVTRKQR